MKPTLFDEVLVEFCAAWFLAFLGINAGVVIVLWIVRHIL